MRQTVFLVEDDDAVRDSLAQVLEGAGFQVRAFASGEAFMAACQGEPFGCAVLDVRLPGMSGPELQEALAARGVDMPIIFLTGHADVPLAVRALKAGAYDFLEKPTRNAALLERVRSALELQRAQHEAKASKAEELKQFELLTERERAVLLEVVAGCSSKEIARRLGISHRTVEVHRANIMRKTRAENTIQLVRLVDAAMPRTTEGPSTRTPPKP
jgi:FixJ family two-component response regulator